MNPDKPYRVATVAYSPGEEYSWVVIRLGKIPEQGGFSFGNSRTNFKTLDDALHFLNWTITQDMDLIKEAIGDPSKFTVDTQSYKEPT